MRGKIQKIKGYGYRIYSDDIFFYFCTDYKTAKKISKELRGII